MSDLDDAITAAVHTEADEHHGTAGLTVTEYVLIAAAAGWNDQGDAITQVVVIPSGPEHRIAGLLRHATIRLDADIAASYEDD